MIDNKTKDMIAKAKVIMNEIEENGGSMSCIVSGYQQKMIHESAWKHMKNVENRDIEVIGVNKYEEEDSDSIEAQELDINNAQKQIDAVTNNKKTRNQDIVSTALEELRDVCNSDRNIMESLINAVKAEATVGEINSVMREVFGTWISPSGV